ncbi:hypothetical protein F4677DRAFT_448696 [Hypoxylon crocopeplum]|nr:hypothetical protein F4677DRAFT_448696 [Hypoxylon crocopeplum]
MDSPANPVFQEIWNGKKNDIIAKHEGYLEHQKKQFEKAKQDAHAANTRNLQELRAVVPPAPYLDIIIPMAEQALELNLQKATALNQRRIELDEKAHKEALAQYEIDYQEALRERLATTKRLPTPAGSNPPDLRDLHEAADGEVYGLSQQQDVSVGPDNLEGDHWQTSWNPSAPQNPSQPPNIAKPLTCTVRHEVIYGERRLIMRVQSQKRRASVSEERPPKRPRVDVSVNHLRTPVATPTEPAPPRERTITFNEVYEDGKANHKDTIVEWPVGSNKWYILKCVKHKMRFTRNPVQGAAKHLNGEKHGFPDRNRQLALNTLGYRVVDCNENLARMNNQAAEEAYAPRHNPKLIKPQGNKAPDESRENQSAKGQESSEPSTSQPTDQGQTAVQGTALTPEKATAERRQESGTPSSEPFDGITNPKTFHIYHGKWKASCHRREGDRTYPVMILGWDDQTGSGLKNTNLNETGLLKKSSHPPTCYVYESNKIVGWAPGYEDGGAKAKARKFPVMFFDESQTVAWLSARHLTKFPLYWRNPPSEWDHPFNAARRWIAEREGFEQWEQREEARNQGRDGDPTAANLDHQLDGNNSDYELEEASIATADTGKLLDEWQEKGGEITGDEDYATSGSDFDDTLDCEMEDWNKANPSTAMPNGTPNRPWAFYGLRSAGAAKDKGPPTTPAHGTRESNSMASVAAGMDSARRLARQASDLWGAYSSTAGHREPPKESTDSAVKPNGEDVAHAVRVASQSEKSSPEDAVPSQPATQDTPAHGDNPVETIEQPLGFTRANNATDTAANQNPTSQSSSEPGARFATSVSRTNVITQASLGDRAASVPQATMSNATLPEATRTTVTPNPSKPSASGSQGNEGVQIGIQHKVKIEEQPSLSCTASSDADATMREKNLGTHPEVESNGNPDNRGLESNQAVNAGSRGEPGAPMAKSSSRVPDIKSRPAVADFELAIYNNGAVSWTRQDEEESCVKLYFSADRKTIVTYQDAIDIKIDPMEIWCYSKEPIPGSNGNSVLLLKCKDGSSMRLAFGCSKGSSLHSGKVQARHFITACRLANPDIRFLQSAEEGA